MGPMEIKLPFGIGKTPSWENPINGQVLGIAGTPVGFDGHVLTPDSLMAFVEYQLGKLDADLINDMNTIEKKKAMIEDLQTMAAKFKEFGEKGIPKNALGGVQYQVVNSKTNEVSYFGTKAEAEAHKKAIEAWGSQAKVNELTTPEAAAAAQDLLKHCNKVIALGDQLGNPELVKEAKNMKAALESGAAISAAAMESMGATLEAAASKLNSSAEMTMIRMQQTMQDRSRILMFVSNALKAMDEPMDQAVRNIT